MIKYLKHTEIDRTKWDECIDNSNTTLIYPNSWFLDLVCAKWDAIVYEKNNNYQMVLPLPWKKKAGLKYVYQPFFTQQLGAFHNEEYEDLEIEKALYREAFKKFRWIELCVAQPIDISSKKISIEKRVTYTLDITQPIEDKIKNYTTNRKRNLKKSRETGIIVSESDDISDFIRFFLEHKAGDIAGIEQKDYHILETVFSKLNERNLIRLITTTLDGENIGYGIFLIYKGRVTFLLGTANEQGRANGAMTLLLNHMIENREEKHKVLDFEGSSIDSIAKFYSSFGAQPEHFWYIKYNNLSFPYNLVKK